MKWSALTCRWRLRTLLLATLVFTGGFAANVRATDQLAIGGGIFFEAEQFDTRHPEEDGFASLVSEEQASDGMVLYRFHHGYVAYHLTVAESGKYAVWLRYAAPGDVRISVAMDPADPPKFEASVVPATGGAAGLGVWRWASVWQGKLSAGEHVLALGSAALRPDCLFITARPNQRPTDKLLGQVKWPGGPRLPELRHQRWITQHPEWLDHHWRVCYAHTEWNRDITIEQWCQMAAEHGANLICAAGEIPAGMLNGQLKPLPVDRKELPPGYQIDYSWVKRYTDAAHRHGLKYLCYVNADRTLDPLLLQHPEWRQVGATGAARPTWGCWNSPYRQAFIDRLVQIARDSRFDGIMIDMGFTAPPGGCHSKYCCQKFHELFDVDAPRRLRLDDPLYQRWIDFQSWTREEWLLDLTEALHQVDPEIAVVVNQTRGWIFNLARRSFLTTRVGRCVDGLLEEIGWETQHTWDRPWAWPLQSPWQNLFLRCRTRPGSGLMWHVTFNMPEVELQAQAYSMLANGALPSVTTGGNWPQMERVWRHVRGCEPWIYDTELIPWVAIHYSEDAISWYANREGSEATNAFMKNVFGLFRAALEAHLPIEIITDDDLASGKVLSRYAVVMLPNSACLSDEQIRSLDHYVQNGGGLLATFQSGMFDSFGAEREQPGLESLFGARQGKADFGVQWAARIAERNHPILDNPVVASAGSWGQGAVTPGASGMLYVGPSSRTVGVVQTNRVAKDAQSLLPLRGAWKRRQGPLRAEKGWAYRGLIARKVGKGRVVYSPLDLGQAYFAYNHPLGRSLIVESLKWAAAASPPLEVKAPMLVQTVAYRKGRTVIVHLVNDISSFGRAAAPNPEAYTGFRSEVIPVRDIRIGLSGHYARVHLLPDGPPLSTKEESGLTWITVPQLDLHAMLVAEPAGE